MRNIFRPPGSRNPNWNRNIMVESCNHDVGWQRIFNHSWHTQQLHWSWPICCTDSVLKVYFARYEIVSDNGTQLTSYLFRKFTKEWMFGHETISPSNSQANGAAEADVKTTKLLWCRTSAEDPLLGLLNIRNSFIWRVKDISSTETIWQANQNAVPGNINKWRPHYHYSAEDEANKEKKRPVYQDSDSELKNLRMGYTVRFQPLKANSRERVRGWGYLAMRSILWSGDKTW